jgi:hypothetical protein
MGNPDSRLTGFSWAARGQRPLNTRGKKEHSGNIDKVEVISLLNYSMVVRCRIILINSNG